MLRFIVGLCFGIGLTVESVFLSEAGHGPYTPWLFAASLLMFVPLISYVAGPMLWGLYFLVVPNLEATTSRLVAVLLILLAHAGPGCWLAVEDPAFRRLSLFQLSVFTITFLGTISLLSFLTFGSKATKDVVS